MSQSLSSVATGTSVSRWGAVDATILAISVAVGVFLWATDPKDLEKALGLGDVETQLEAQMQLEIAITAGPPPAASTRDVLREWNGNASNLATHFMPSLILGSALATFRHKSSRTGRALRYAGILTTAVAALFVAGTVGSEFVLRKSGLLNKSLVNTFSAFWGGLAQNVSLAITTLWIILFLSRTWRSSACWEDRCGRVIGAACVVYAVASLPLAYVLLPR
jgi:hypothetical protein